jgi:hypothetical protein
MSISGGKGCMSEQMKQQHNFVPQFHLHIVILIFGNFYALHTSHQIHARVFDTLLCLHLLTNYV